MLTVGAGRILDKEPTSKVCPIPARGADDWRLCCRLYHSTTLNVTLNGETEIEIEGVVSIVKGRRNLAIEGWASLLRGPTDSLAPDCQHSPPVPLTLFLSVTVRFISEGLKVVPSLASSYLSCALRQ